MATVAPADLELDPERIELEIVVDHDEVLAPELPEVERGAGGLERFM